MKFLALSIQGNGTIPGFNNLQFPTDLNNLNNLTLQDILKYVINAVLVVSIVLAFFFILIGGLKWIMSQGDKKQLENAQKTVMYAVIGLVVVLLSFFIINLIGFVFGVQGSLLSPK